MSVLKEAAIAAGGAYRQAFCLVNNIVNPNKAHLMTMIENEGPERHVTWQIVYQNPGEVIDIPTPFVDMDDSES